MKLMLIGIKHSGKTTVARELSRRWQLPFFDSDDMLLAQIEQQGQLLSLRDYFVKVGAAVFYQQQGELLQRFFSSAPSAYVLASGGGIGESNNLILPKDVLPLLLDEDVAVVWRRLMSCGIPPFLPNGLEPELAFYQLIERRLPVLRRLAKMVYRGSNKPIALVCDEIGEMLKNAR